MVISPVHGVAHKTASFCGKDKQEKALFGPGWCKALPLGLHNLVDLWPIESLVEPAVSPYMRTTAEPSEALKQSLGLQVGGCSLNSSWYGLHSF